MEFRFNAEEWQRLTNEERVRRCRLMAGQARVLAERAPPQLKEGYLSISGEWLKLVAEIERTAKYVIPDLGPSRKQQPPP